MTREVCGGGVKSHILFETISSLENLFAAWREFIPGKCSCQDVQKFARYLEDNIFSLHRQLCFGTYRHGSYAAFRVYDPKPRQIHKASVADRLVHHALVRVIQPLIERSFIFDTWSCRLGKGTHAAVERCQQQLDRLAHNKQAVWILKCDIKKYFANIDHATLLSCLRRFVPDARAFGLIKNIVESFNPGLPLGNLTSQLFANAYLSPFDHYIKEQFRARAYLRYSDDFLIADTSLDRLVVGLPLIHDFLQCRLKLILHPAKIIFKPYHHGIDWLGHMLYPGYRVLRASTRRRLWRSIARIVQAHREGELDHHAVRSVLASYNGVLQHAWNQRDHRRLICLMCCL